MSTTSTPPAPRAVAVAFLLAAAAAAVAGCPDPQGATCDEADACAEGVCVAGVCTVQPCNGDSDCPGEAVCGNGTCVARTTDVDAGAIGDGGARVDAGTATEDGGADLDAGTTIDGGVELDAGAEVDAGAELDAGATLDGGANLDGGDGLDGGALDAGAPIDGGVSLDGGTAVDGGALDGGDAIDAGGDAGAGSCFGAPPICATQGQPVVFVTVAEGGAVLANRVDQAADGSLIVVEAGAYSGGFDVDVPRSLTLVAEGGQVVVNAAAGEALQVKNQGQLLVQGFKFTGGASPIVRAENIGFVLHLVDCVVSGLGDGVRNRTGAQLIVDRSDIRGNGGTGLVLEGPAVVTNTFVVDNGSGVAISGVDLALDLRFTTIAGNGQAFDGTDTCPTFFGVIVAANGSDTACGMGVGICAAGGGGEGFVAAGSGDYHLSPSSGFADQIADDQGKSSGEDVDADARPLGSSYDCGADEVLP